VSEVIGDRAFHRDPVIVFELAFAYMQGMHTAGMAATGKHFPGHGAVVADSHVAIPEDSRDHATLWREDITPFRRLIDNGLAAIMPAHVIYSQIDPAPAGFSRYWLQTVLRGQLGFKGVIFSDDLNMEGASVAGSDYVARAHAAFTAGCDMALICNNRLGAIQILDRLGPYQNPVARSRLARLHGQHTISHQALQHQARWAQVRHDLAHYLDNPSYALKF
jgi:beta-N-acetylhexosaminidase